MLRFDSSINLIFASSTPGLLAQIFICDHMRCPEYYLESIVSQCPMHGYLCANQLDFERGRCATPRSGEELPVMGYYAEKTKSRNASGKYFLETNRAPPFCGR